MAIHEELLRLRRARRLRQVDMAGKVGVSPDTYRRWEAGKYQPRADQLVKLAKALGTTTEELLHQEEVIEHGEGGTCGTENAGAGTPDEC